MSCLLPNIGLAQTDTVFFSNGGGFYDSVFSLKLSNCFPENHIRYTTNGNRPTAQSLLYSDSLTLDASLFSMSNIHTLHISPESLVFIPDSIQHCIVIRAATFDENDSCTSAVATQSFFIRALGCENHNLPVISICADSLDLFDFDRGILVPGVHYDSLNIFSGNYYQKGRDWEREVNVEFYEKDGNCGINQVCGLRTQGFRARCYPQKGLKVYARKEYGKKRFKYKFFEDSQVSSFKHLIMKPFSSLAPYSGVQDYVCNRLALGLGLEAAHCRPIRLYLNGEYWGLYFLQEKMDGRYLEDQFGIDIEHCNIIKNWNELECGHSEGFLQMMNWLRNADLSLQEDYDYLSQLIDVENFTDYMILETFVTNVDWPANNMRCWQKEGGKWRWMFFDGDATLTNLEFKVFENATYVGVNTWPTSTEATLMFRKLLENHDYRSRFESRMAELCRDFFSYDNTYPILQQIMNMIRPEIQFQSYRFGYPRKLDKWNWACSLSKNFLKLRTESYIAEWFSYISIPSVPTQTGRKSTRKVVKE